MIKPLELLVDRLAAKLRIDPSGAKSLAHLLVVVPTAQSGRRLRLALAARFGARVPPTVVTTFGYLLDQNDETVAGRTEEIRAFFAARGGKDESYAIAAELADLRALLLPRALTFAEVAAAIRDDFPEEAGRWQELAELETKYCAALAERGKTDRILAAKAWAAKRDAEKWGTEETLRFDEPASWLSAQPSVAALVQREQVTPCATAPDEAARLAEYFAAVKPEEAYPALCIADPTMFPEVVAAFAAKGMTVHNPSETPLVTSSLGHLVAQLVALKRTQSYSVFSAFLRSGDGRRWLQSALALTEEEFAAALIDLDNRQAEFLPEKLEDIAPKTQGKLRAIFEFIQAQLRKKGPRELLAAIFATRMLDERDAAAREFAAAATVVIQLIDVCGEDSALFELRLNEATYSLEPDEGEVILTDGWMELPFLAADELVIAGLQEGRVPESTVGHPFLPDSLRHFLKLPDNAMKEARDRAILSAVVASRPQANVRLTFHAIDAAGDVLKPSRLLFETPDDADLIARVRAFYSLKAGTAGGLARDLPANWKLKLPLPPEHAVIAKIAPTRLDSYLRCPFTYYLKDKAILGDKRMDDRAEELQSWEFGNLAHEALEAFGQSALKDSAEAAAIRDFLLTQVDDQLTARFGTAIPVIVAMQGESVKRRLANFAELQAAHRAEGWQIVAVERKLRLQYDHTELYGKCDRIDFHAQTGQWLVIDYKTFDKADKANCREPDGTWRSIQLPVYCAMLDLAQEPDLIAARRDHVSACYCVLGKTKDEVKFSAPMSGELVADAERLIRETLIPRIEAGIFWPPARTGEWKYDYEDWLKPNPEASVDEAWIADQERRLQALEAGDGT